MFIALQSNKRDSRMATLLRPWGKLYSEWNMPGDDRKMNLAGLYKAAFPLLRDVTDPTERKNTDQSASSTIVLPLKKRTSYQKTYTHNSAFNWGSVSQTTKNSRYLYSPTQSHATVTQVCRQAPLPCQKKGTPTRYLLDASRDQSLPITIGHRVNELITLATYPMVYNGNNRLAMQRLTNLAHWHTMALSQSAYLKWLYESSFRSPGSVSVTRSITAPLSANAWIKITTQPELQWRHQKTLNRSHLFHPNQVRFLGLVKGTHRLVGKDTIIDRTLEEDGTVVKVIDHPQILVAPLKRHKNHGLDKLIKVIETQNQTKNQKIHIDLTLPDVSHADTFIGELQSIIDTIG